MRRREVTHLYKDIVFIQPHLRYGGAENQTVQILNDLSRDGYRCALILHRAEGGLLPMLSDDVTVFNLGFQNHLLLPIGALRLARVLRQLAPTTIVVRLWSSILMTGFVHKVAPQHTYYYYEDLDPRNHREFIRFGKLKQNLIGHIFRKNQHNLLTNTDHVAHAMPSIYRLTTQPMVIECGVDEEFCRSHATPPETNAHVRDKQTIYVTTVGSLAPRKGLMQLTEQLGTSQIPICWTLVGDGPLRWELEKVAKSYSNIEMRFVGGTPNPYPYMASSDFILHGAISESFGIVIVEALALGKPVLVNQANGPIEIKAKLPRLPLVLFDINDPNDLPRKLQNLSRDMKTRVAGENVPLGPYAIESVTEKWKRLIKN
jgi:glycosyltransferase involved in cell wall biosynthesis